MDSELDNVVELAPDIVSESSIAEPLTPVLITGLVSVLFVNVCEPVKVATVESIEIAPELISIPVLPLICALTSAALGPVYVNTPVVLLYAKLPSPPASVTLKSASTWVTVKISLYVEPSFVNCHLSVPSSYCNFTFVEVPLSTSIPASWEGVPVSLLLRTITLSSTVNVSVLIVV